MDRIEDGGIKIPVSEATFNDFINDESRVHVVTMGMRPGVGEFMTLLEFKHFKPLTARNDLFIMHTYVEQGIPWIIMSIPVEEQELLEAIAQETGMRVSKGIPVLVSGNGTTPIVPPSDRVYSLENASGHPAYKNDPRVNDALREGELESMDRIRKTYQK